MQRKRSYVEAMEAGSVYDLLEASNSLVTGAFNASLGPSADNGRVTVKSASAENLINPRLGEINFHRSENLPRSSAIPSEASASIDGAHQDFTQIYSDREYYGGNMNRHKNPSDGDLHIRIEHEDEVIERGSSGAKVSPMDPNSNGRSASLIDEVYNNCAQYIANEEAKPRKSGFVLADLHGEHVLHFNASDLDDSLLPAGEESGQNKDGPDQAGRESSNSGESATQRQFSNDYSRDDELSDDLVSRETQYESDDNILEFDGEANEIVETVGKGMKRVNSLLIPNNAMSDKSSSIVPCLYTGRNSSRKLKRTQENVGFRARRSKRVVFKNGETNIPKRQHISGLVGKFMKDIVTTLIECRWRWLILLFSIGHFLLWLAFAMMFYLASYANGDLSDSPGDIPCIENGKTFTGIFTFSVETQVSIGYGEKSPTEECPETIFIMVMEVVAGYVVVGGMVGIVYAKIVRPQKNLEGVGFSRRAVVCMRDGRLCLLVRVWDVQQKHAVGTRASGWLVQHGGPRSTSLALSPQNPLVLWPTTLEHVIDEHSPLYDWSAKDFVDQRFEVVITLTGSSRLTGQMTQSRTSYLPSDILWGQRFKKVLSYNAQKGVYLVDHKSLNKVTQVDSPLCSARLLRQLTQEGLASPLFRSTPSSPPSTLASPGWSFRKQFKPIVVRTAS